MNCPKCGSPQSPDVSFCAQCGSAVKDTQQSKLLKDIKRIASSTLMLVAVIAFTLSTVLNIAVNLQPVDNDAAFEEFFNNLPEDLKVALEEAELSEETFISGTESIDVIGSVVSAIPMLLIAIGLWAVYITASNKNDTIKIKGLGLLKGVSILMLVLVCLVSIPVLMVVVALLASMQVLEHLAPIIAVISLLAVVVIIFAITYYAKIISMISGVKSLAVGGNAKPNASALVALICYISGGIGIISFIFAFSSYNILLALSTVCAVVSSFVFGSIIMSYRDSIKRNLD